MSALDDRPFPNVALAGAGIVIALSLGVTAAARLGAFGPTRPPTAVERQEASMARPALTREFRFRDAPAGAEAVDVRSGAVIVLPAGKDGFVRGVVRSFARDRRARGVPPEAPFRLTRWSDGALTLDDLATGRSIDLIGFGHTNEAAFDRLLHAAGETPK